MKPLVAILLAALILVLAGPASAAQKCVAPPGTAAIEQYCETVPSASGDQPSGGVPTSPGGSGSGVSSNTADQIAASLGDRAEQSITGVRREKRGHAGAKSSRPKAAKGNSPVDADANPLSAVASAAGTGAEVGGPLIYTLLALTLLLVGVAWARFRRTGS